ncbi:MAG: dipeptide epimerase [Devosia sp. 67-54]|uniref:mandelate racemase/muconate lactonizing enzyme family protein n=1 Tax=Devosia sp. 67-54 TaxID=1895754 RepID=UPI00095FCFE6|nr:dipeptide epimerase [Devosia sp. 67-54]OJX19689.1 MAG: dipeptide epimerase [Devosia sp. 67-54]
MGRITRIELYRAPMPMKVPFKVAIGTTTISQSLFVRVHSDDGIVGVGEGNIFTPVTGETPDSVWAAAPGLAQALLGSEAHDIAGRAQQMLKLLPNNTTLRSALEIALWDGLGKAGGLPLFALLGGRRRAIVTDNTVGIDTPEMMAERAAGFKARGFRVIKVKLGTDLATDLARMRAIRAAVGAGFPLRIDANQGWSRTVARAALAALPQFAPELVEQPVVKWDVEGLAELRRGSAIPIMADEALFDSHDALRLVAAGACDYFNIKLAKAGGIHMALGINAIGEAAGIACMVGCMTDAGVAIAAAVHLASARENIVFADLDGADMLAVDPVAGGFAYGAGGELWPAEAPGLGVELDAGYLAGLETRVVE